MPLAQETIVDRVFGPQPDGAFWRETDQKIENIIDLVGTNDPDAITGLLDRVYRVEGEPPAGDGCDRFPGARNTGGYGNIKINGKMVGVHVAAFTIHNGRPVPGTEVDHTCHSNDESCPGGKTCAHRPCRRTGHLEAVPHAVNVQRGRNAQRRKTHCSRGHAYAEHGIRYRCADGYARRFCVACRPVVETVTVRARRP